MIEKTLQFLNKTLNEHLASLSGPGPANSQEAKVAFPESNDTESAGIRNDVITSFLINIEEERKLREPDPFVRNSINGSVTSGQPSIKLNLYVMYIARFSNYAYGLAQLSAIIRFFQANRVFNQESSPRLDASIGKLVVEMITLPFDEQNEVWSSLRCAYYPSIIYRVKMLVFAEDGAVTAGPVTDKDISTEHRE